jgi:ElaA protein
MNIYWTWRHFSQLDRHELYTIMRIRQQVFAVEQNCAYLDADGIDYHAWHLLGLTPQTALIAYLRLIEPGKKFSEPSIGRVLTSLAVRGRGIGRQLMAEGIRGARARFPEQGMRISAQQHLEQFYKNLGFQTVSEPYLEEGIIHLEMYLASITQTG